MNDNGISIPSETLEALRALRDAVPKLADSLKPAPTRTADQSGLILEDWGGWGPPSGQTHQGQRLETETATASAVLPDTDPAYWKPVAVLDENGCITQLLLGRQRLATVDVDLLRPLLKHVVRLDLAGTSLPVEAIIRVLDECCQQQNSSAVLTHLYLGGNELGDAGFVPLASHLPTTTNTTSSLHVLDARYNNLGPASAQALAKYLQTVDCEKVYLEGNALGDEGATHLASSVVGSVRELYLGANKIGAAGAGALAQGLLDSAHNNKSQLEKLYLEGNRIGPAGAISFRKALESLGHEKKLQKLYVDNNEIGKAEAMKLGQALMSSTMIGDPGI